MEFYKRQVKINNSFSGDTGTYYLQILLTQDIEDIGVYEDDEDDNGGRNHILDQILN